MACVLVETIADLFRQAAVSAAPALAQCSGQLAYLSRQQLVVTCCRPDLEAVRCAVQEVFAGVQVHASLPRVKVQLQLSST